MNHSAHLTVSLAIGLAVAVIIGAASGQWLFWLWMGIGVGAAVGNVLGYLNRPEEAAFEGLSRRRHLVD